MSQLPNDKTPDMEKSSIMRLREITENLGPPPHEHAHPANYVRFKVDFGSAYAYGLKKTKAVAVADLSITAGTDFPLHPHDEIEHHILYKGKVRFHCEGRESVLMSPGDCITVAPGLQHGGTAIEDSEIICITVPAAGGFPDGGT